MSARVLLVAVALVLAPLTTLAQSDRPRIREVGVAPGVLSPGSLNAITDVAGVRVGHQTLVEGDSIRTGVTAILPHAGSLYQQKVPAAVYVGNGFGKAAGFLQVQELGTIETPIVLTNTLSVGTAVESVVAWTLRQPGNNDVHSVNAVVGETNDGYLNDIRGQHVTPDDVVAAIESAQSGPVPEGSVGAGTGTRALGWKGGIGTSSRHLPDDLGGFTVGALVQANYGGILRIDGVPVGERLGRYAYRDVLEPDADAATDGDAHDDGSCMIVLATDAPLSPRNLERMAKRAIQGLARTGSFMSNGSGDFVIAFSTQNRRSGEATRSDTLLANRRMSPLFLATVETVEEAVYNALTKATTVHGRDGHVTEAIPIDRLRAIFEGTE